MNTAFIENIIVWVVDFFKVRNPKLFAIIAVALVAVLSVLKDATDKGLVCSGWEKQVVADQFVTLKPGDSLDLNTFVPDSLDGQWINEDDGLILGDQGGIRSYIYQDTGAGVVITVATNTCFINDTSGLINKILYWIGIVVLALTGVHTSEKKREILAKRQKS